MCNSAGTPAFLQFDVEQGAAERGDAIVVGVGEKEGRFFAGDVHVVAQLGFAFRDEAAGIDQANEVRPVRNFVDLVDGRVLFVLQ